MVKTVKRGRSFEWESMERFPTGFSASGSDVCKEMTLCLTP